MKADPDPQTGHGAGSSIAVGPPSGAAAPPNARPIWAALLLILLLATALRVRFLSMPLERDEGEYAYAGQLILQGTPPYAQMYNMKMPGIYVCYALIMGVFGQTPFGIHLGLLLASESATVLVFLLGRRLLDDWSAVAAAGAFAVFSISAELQGVFANAEHFVLVPTLAGFLLLIDATRSDPPATRNQGWHIFLGGLLLGLGFVIKQHGAAYIAWGGLYLLGVTLRNAKAESRPTGEPRRAPLTLPATLLARLSLFSAGAILPFAFTMIAFLLLDAFYSHGIFQNARFWTFTYASQYVQEMSLAQGWVYFRDLSPFGHINPTDPLWCLSLLGLFTPLWDRRVRAGAPFLLGLSLFAALAVCPGLYFRPHYFLLFLPAAALWAGAATQGIATLMVRRGMPQARVWAPLSLVAVAVACTLATSRNYYFLWSPHQIAHKLYGPNPFPEALEVAAYIRAHTSPTDRILIMGSEPEIFFYAQRRSATGFIYMYPLMEDQPYALPMQRQFISEAQAANPAMVVFVGVAQSWDVTPDSQTLISDWFTRYCPQYFQRVGLVDIKTWMRSDFHWAPAAIPEAGRDDAWVAVYQRRAAPSPPS